MEINQPLQEIPENSQDSIKSLEKIEFKLEGITAFLFISIIINLFFSIPLLFALKEGGGSGGWALLIIIPKIILTLPFIIILLILQTYYWLKIQKYPQPKKITFSSIVMVLGYLLLAGIVGLWILLMIPQWQAQADQRHFQEEVDRGQKMMQQMDALKATRSKILIEYFKNPHQIVRFVDYGDVNFHGPYTKQIDLLLDNNVEISIMATKTEEEEKTILAKLNNLNLQGTSIIANPFTFMPDYYSCQNPDFSNNTCGRDILLNGAELRFLSDNKPLDKYLYCHIDYFPFIASSFFDKNGVFDSKGYCSITQ